MVRRSHIQSALDTTTSLATLIAAGAVSYFGGVSPREVSTARTGTVAASVQAVRVEGRETRLGTVARTSRSAKIAIVEFSDFECPFCGRYARDSYPQIVAK